MLRVSAESAPESEMNDWQGMSLEEKVGQLLVVGFFGHEPDAHIRHLLQDRHVGGVILFARNIRDAAHVAELTRQLQALARRPLLVAADQEGGSVLRVRHGASLLPSAMGMGRLDEAAVADLGRICGEEMRAMGLNWNLAPVLDVNRPENPGIGIRSFGEDPAKVARYGAAYIRALQGAGVLACAKHFPGKGAAKLDAHLDLPRIDRDLAQLEESELVPFRAAIAADVASMLTSHCLYPRLDDQPATLSHRMLTGLLRNELGFGGLLVTDDMEMGAIARYSPWPAAAVAAFAAGADQILICHDPAKQASALDALVAAIQRGDVPEARLDQSLARIARAKARIAPRPATSVTELTERHAPAVRQYCERIVEVLRDPAGQLPLGGETVDVYWPEMGVLTMVEEGTLGEELVREAFRRRFADVRLVPFNPKEPDADAVSGGRPVVFFSANAHLYPGQARLIQSVREQARGFVLAPLRNPYDQALVPDSDTVVLGYGFLPNALAATVGAMID